MRTGRGGAETGGAPGCCSASPRSGAPRSGAAAIRDEEDLVARVAELRGRSAGRAELEALLAEGHPVYAGRGSAAVVRMRGWLLLALGEGGLAESSLPFVLEELESGHDAYLTAAAARVLRGFPERRGAFCEPLLAALLYLRHRDDAVSLTAYGGYGAAGEKTSAVGEILDSLAWLGGAARAALPRLDELRREAGLTRGLTRRVERTVKAIANADPEEAGAGTSSCCSRDGGLEKRPSAPPSPGEIDHLELEDQDGERVLFGDFFRGAPTIVAFFYTRCDNPTKCQLTVTRLGRAQRLLRAEGLDGRVRTAAITYDPGFDHPRRLARYAATWGFEPGGDHRMLRAVDGLDTLRAHFDLGVNYVSSVVNRHRIEVFVLDAEGRIREALRRRQWDEREVVAKARALLA